MSLRKSRVVFALMVALISVSVHADAIDIVAYIARSPGGLTLGQTVGYVIFAMFLNYGFNFMFVGLAADTFGRVPLSQIARDMILFTIVAQVADRVGAIIALFASDALVNGLGLSTASALILCNFAFSGIAIGLLAYIFLRLRWQVAGRPLRAITLIAAVLTNPAWALLFLTS